MMRNLFIFCINLDIDEMLDKNTGLGLWTHFPLLFLKSSFGFCSLKIDEICPLAIPNQISLMSIFIASLVKIPCYLLKLLSGNEIMGVFGADNSVKI